MYNKIMVSIICNTYNHQNYIKDALESFINQKTDFKFEVLIHDDASTDNTPYIIREYEKKYPDIIKPIYQKENQYSKGIKISQTYQYPRVKGKYIAICEGDDYWIDSQKLQKQVKALEQNFDIDMCAHATIMVKAETKDVIKMIAPDSNNSILTIENVILNGGGYVATNSLLYRASLNKNIPDFRNEKDMDYTLQIHGALRGGILYLNDCMSAYRWMSIGSWSSQYYIDINKQIQLFEKFKIVYNILDKDTAYRFSKVIMYREMMDVIPLCEFNKDYKKTFYKKYSLIFNNLKFFELFKILIRVYFPLLLKIKRKLFK